jgi:hypothetical protein
MEIEVLGGSCLCEAVRYRVEAPFLRFAHCHCTRCRKATGTGRATNLYAAPARFRWTSGQESTVRFDLPTARSFATTFAGIAVRLCRTIPAAEGRWWCPRAPWTRRPAWNPRRESTGVRACRGPARTTISRSIRSFPSRGDKFVLPPAAKLSSTDSGAIGRPPGRSPHRCPTATPEA